MYNWSPPVTNCTNCTFQNISPVFSRRYIVFCKLIGLYQVASQCRQFYAPKHRSKRNKQGLNQQLRQTASPTDDCIPGLQTRPILVLMVPSPLLAPSILQTPALQQDRVTEESTSKTVSQPPKPIEDRSLDNETRLTSITTVRHHT